MPRGSTIIPMCSINAFIGRPDLLDCMRLIAIFTAGSSLIDLLLDTSAKGAIVSFAKGLSNQIVGDKMIRVNSTCLFTVACNGPNDSVA